MIKKQVQELQAGDLIVADMSPPNMVIMTELDEKKNVVITTEAGSYTKEPGFEVNVEEASVFSRTAWVVINDFWGAKEGDNRKFTRSKLHSLVMEVREKAELASE